jgi:molecular chaperone HtpG
VLLLPDPIDEYCIQNLAEYEKRKVKSIANDEVNILDNTEIAKKKNQKLKEMYKPLTDWFKGHLGRQVEKVQVSSKLGDTPLYIFTQEYGYSAQMEKINRNQALRN